MIIVASYREVSLENRRMSAASITAEIEGVQGQSVSAHCIKVICMAVALDGGLDGVKHVRRQPC